MNGDGIHCPACAASLTTTEVLEACSVSVAGCELLRLRCPRCGAAALARVLDGRVELGSGEGGAGFRVAAGADEPELFVRRDVAWMDCWHGKVHRRFPVVA